MPRRRGRPHPQQLELEVAVDDEVALQQRPNAQTQSPPPATLNPKTFPNNRDPDPPVTLTVTLTQALGHGRARPVQRCSGVDLDDAGLEALLQQPRGVDDVRAAGDNVYAAAVLLVEALELLRLHQAQAADDEYEQAAHLAHAHDPQRVFHVAPRYVVRGGAVALALLSSLRRRRAHQGYVPLGYCCVRGARSKAVAASWWRWVEVCVLLVSRVGSARAQSEGRRAPRRARERARARSPDLLDVNAVGVAPTLFLILQCCSAREVPRRDGHGRRGPAAGAAAAGVAL
eukprot:CAMPEP_0118850602 /NCGR_PEP_ID=MMETSP1163-20130328/386_1 /TAXON_ID=124430 /ORGANISM="Phaeomonas parva, Strain CCMP2877" /LENGTH=286 /DNA_ID=CAMNT_0006782827 /DNA_START=80 /DNA_END=940 /DNA_ORIENTATION=+